VDKLRRRLSETSDDAVVSEDHGLRDNVSALLRERTARLENHGGIRFAHPESPPEWKDAKSCLQPERAG